LNNLENETISYSASFHLVTYKKIFESPDHFFVKKCIAAATTNATATAATILGFLVDQPVWSYCRLSPSLKSEYWELLEQDFLHTISPSCHPNNSSKTKIESTRIIQVWHIYT